MARHADAEVMPGGQRDYMAWQRARESALAAGAVPSVRVRTTTEWAVAATDAMARPVETLSLDADTVRPGGPRYGSLVHAVLATVPLDADTATIEAIVSTQTRVLGATAEESRSATEVLAAVLGHPLFDDVRAAARAGRCLREAPVTVTIGDELIEGTVDLAFDVSGCTTVIDFKTDRVEGERLARYQRQVGLYADAIARVTNGPVRAVLMMI